jgi:hypothetical protein
MIVAIRFAIFIQPESLHKVHDESATSFAVIVIARTAQRFCLRK